MSFLISISGIKLIESAFGLGRRITKMKRNMITAVFTLIIIFAILGFITQLFGNTRNFLIGLFTMVGFAVVIFALLYLLVNRTRGSGSSNEMRKYKQAVKQSKSKYQQTTPKKPTQTTTKKQNNVIGRKNRKRPTHLRVIDGNKSKGKDRANF